jgi:hypothetical protein
MSMRPTSTNVLIPVLDQDSCIGHLIRRFNGVEAFVDDQSIGLFESDAKAAAALWRCRHWQTPQATEESHGQA